MRAVIFAVTLAGMVATPVYAAGPLVLKCTASNGEVASDLTVDLAHREMKWGTTPYKVTSVSTRYVTAVQNFQDEVGGEIWVLDRATGDYQRAAVYMGCIDTKCTESRLTARTFTGQCVRPQL